MKDFAHSVETKNVPSVLNDYRPVAVTSSLERIVLNHIIREMQHKTDPFQFAYRNGRSTKDMLLYMLHNIYCHLDQRYSRVLLVDFSPHLIALDPML